MAFQEAELLRRMGELEQEVEALRGEAGRYRNLFINSPDIIYYLDRGGKFTRISEEAFDPLGYPNADVQLEEYISQVVLPEDQERVISHFYTCVASKIRDVRGLTFRIKKNSGEILWVELYSRINYDESGEFLEEVGFLRDVTERRKMEERLLELNGELAETNEKLQAAYRWMRENHDYLKSHRYEEDIGFLVDKDGRIEWSSDGALSLTGRTRTALIDTQLTELIPQESLKVFRSALDQAWRGITKLFPIEFKAEGEIVMSMEMKMTRLTSRETRRLWVLLQRPLHDTKDKKGGFS